MNDVKKMPNVATIEAMLEAYYTGALVHVRSEAKREALLFLSANGMVTQTSPAFLRLGDEVKIGATAKGRFWVEHLLNGVPLPKEVMGYEIPDAGGASE